MARVPNTDRDGWIITLNIIPEDHPKLDPYAILIAEFQYIAQTAFQANEDRARVSS
jgi:hypothetical protein